MNNVRDHYAGSRGRRYRSNASDGITGGWKEDTPFPKHSSEGIDCITSNSLVEIMDDIGVKAQSRGLTPEILKDLLRDE